MSSFEAVVDAVRDEGMSLRQQLAAQAAEQESPAVRDAKEAEDARRQENTNKLLEKIANDVASTGKSIDISASDEDSGFGGFIKKFFTLKKLLIGGAIALAIPVIMGFLKSDLWTKLKTTIKEDILPALESIYKTFKEDIYPILEKTFLKQIKLVQGVIKDITAAFTKMADGDFLCGMYNLIVGLGSYILKSVNNISTGLYNIIAKIFGLEETDSVYGSISKFFKDTYKSVVDSIASSLLSVKNTITTTYNNIKNSVICFFTDIVNKAKNLFDFSGIEDEFMNLNLVKYVKSVFGDLFESICGIFAGDFSMKNLLKGGKALLDIVQAPLNIAINAINDIFKFGDPKEPFRLSKFITDVVQSIVCWFEDNFSWETIKSKIESGIDIVKSIKDKVSSIVTSVVCWFEDTFSWKTIKSKIESGFDFAKSIGDSISSAVEEAIIYFKDLFSFENLKDLIPSGDDLKSFIGIGSQTDEEKAAELRKKNAERVAELQKEIAELEKGIRTGEYNRSVAGFTVTDDKDERAELAELQAELAKLQNVAKTNIGGITTKQGLVNIHPQEAIIPLEKMDEVINKINTAALSKTGGAGAPVVVNNVTNAPVDASSSSVTNAATMPISPPTNYVAIL